MVLASHWTTIEGPASLLHKTASGQRGNQTPAIYGKEAHLDDFINVVVLDLTGRVLERTTTNKNYRYNPDHSPNRMTIQERMAYFESGGVGF
jgi:hypothetical protein